MPQDSCKIELQSGNKDDNDQRRHTGGHKRNPLTPEKKDSYYNFAREEIVDTIVKSGIPAKRILEIGCAGGATGKKIRETIPVDYYAGVDISAAAAVVAGVHLDTVITADIEKTDLHMRGLNYEDFDLLLALDVLEHCYNPWDLLANLKRYIKPGGHIIASIPNIQNITIVDCLIHGKWHYENAGILDVTHIRFFTLEEIIELFSGADLHIKRVDYVLHPPIDLSKVKDSGNSLNHCNISITNLNKDEITRFFIYQYIVTARKEA